ncbi:MAG: ankyrin repeat domain-containing protein [Alphaproteobacteria bacterium]|nr:MAG: ankyrin repeat domain-containing protein [Alphaproteobacteria bacterium]
MFIVLVKALIAAGADRKPQNKFGETAIMIAAENGYGEIVELLNKVSDDTDLQSKSKRRCIEKTN